MSSPGGDGIRGADTGKPVRAELAGVGAVRTRLSRRERAMRLAKRPPRVLIDDFERLSAGFADHVLAARKLKVTDPKHDALIRVALRGFSLTSKVFKWGPAHFAYIQRKARPIYAGMGEGPLLFYCLATGYALGLAEEDELTKPEFRAAEDHLDQLIRLSLPHLKSALLEALRVG